MYRPGLHQRRSVRVATHDYTRGAYFVTICTWDRLCLFGEVVEREMRLNALGEAVEATLAWLAAEYRRVTVHERVVMPNHVHVALSLDASANPVPVRTLGAIVAAFKASSTRRVNLLRDAQGVTLWQRNYHEHGIRNAEELARIRHYIAANPANWPADEENPENRP